MEVHPRVNSVLPKRLWNFLRIAFYMMRKGLVSKRKLIIDMNLMMKRGKVLGKKTFGNLIHHHHHHSSSRVPVRGYGLQEYEFSCSNSPNPVFFHVGKRKHHYFPCINAQDEDPEEEMTPPPPTAVVPVRKIEYPSPEYSFNFRLDGGGDFAPGEKLSPLRSPFSVQVSDYSGIDEAGDGGIGTPQVDAAAEEFIRRFYDQLRMQSRTALLQYQETEYQEMLARGC
ncbi:hypothetical protein H6P81_013463 [Aristolochia fimbriata]|uniref:Uncharacterized protein n=1 Tax=Aristolochia fimbriata TaxID=158543 RepID=A0AAV7EET4_ARIFI|nr:hypothetical protein H6P81_013463 [Aristolochia fimbriata]